MRRADAVCAVVLLVLAGVVVVEGFRLGVGWGTDGPQPGFFIFYLGVGLAACSAVILAQAALVRDVPLYRKPFVEPGQLGPVAKVALPAVGLVLLTHLVGLYVAGALYVASYMRVIGRHPWLQTILVAVAIPLISFLVFEIWFLVPMPKGPLESYLGY